MRIEIISKSCYNDNNKGQGKAPKTRKGKKMTKRECINYCVQEQRKAWENPTNYSKRTASFEHCKEICKRNGYTGGAFTKIWQAAVRKCAIKDGVYRP